MIFMKETIRQHRASMNFSNTKLAIETKLKQELIELHNEIDTPTSTNNCKKEIADCIIMINAYCDMRGWNIEDVVKYGIEINESRR